MAGLKIEGDLSQVSDRQLEYIKSVIEERGYKNNKVIIDAVGKAGDNYVANVKRITVEDDNGGTFKMVAKIAPTNEVHRKMGNTEALFRNEHIMYTKVLPKYTQLEKAAEVPVKERLRYAICYGSSDEVPNEVIVLEDLNESNFQMLDRFQPLQIECVKSVLKNFALIHSLSYALKYKEPLVYEEYKNSLFDMWAQMAMAEETIMYFKQMESSASTLVDRDAHKKAILGSINGAMEFFAKNSNVDRDAKHSVILQGDAWTNNIMFKFDEENLWESIMIDYQISKPANPVNDLLYMIFNCTDYESRKTHFYDWIDYYHNELDKSLSNYGLKVNLIYPKDQLDVDLKRYAKSAFGQLILLTGVLTMNSEEAGAMKESMESFDIDETLKRTEISNRKPETIAIFKKRIQGLIDSFDELGLIKVC